MSEIRTILPSIAATIGSATLVASGHPWIGFVLMFAQIASLLAALLLWKKAATIVMQAAKEHRHRPPHLREGM